MPKEVFGEKKLSGVLVVDRYNGYNKAPCSIQYCYAHLLREFEDLEKCFPDGIEIRSFASTVIPLITEAIKLRAQPISDDEFYKKAKLLKGHIVEVMNKPAKHLGIRRLQDIFIEKADRLYLKFTS